MDKENFNGVKPIENRRILNSEEVKLYINKYYQLKGRYNEHMKTLVKKPNSIINYDDLEGFSSNMPLIFREGEGELIIEVTDYHSVIFRQRLLVPKSINLKRELNRLNNIIYENYAPDKLYNMLLRTSLLYSINNNSDEIEKSKEDLMKEVEKFKENYGELINKRESIGHSYAKNFSEIVDKINLESENMN